MDELGDKLSAILNDPESMERVKQMAQSLLGGRSRQRSSAGYTGGACRTAGR